MILRLPLLVLTVALTATADVVVDVNAFGEGLGGWKARKGQAAEYQISDAGYRTYRPEVSPSPDGGIYVSVRIDHRRGFFSSDDHASLELSFSSDGSLVSAQSSLALQGRTITSELIKGGSSAATSVAAPGISQAVKVGSDLVADLSAKILREKIIEPGRVSFPAAIRHNYNLLYKAVKTQEEKEATPAASISSPTPEPGTTPPATPAPSTPTEAGPVEEPAATPAPTTPSAPAPTPAPASTPEAPPPPTQAQKKEIPIPEVKPYNPGQAALTPLPPAKPVKEKSLLLEHGDEALKLAREILKSQNN